MPSGKQYEMLFKLNAQANSGFKGAFSQAQAEFARLGNEIQSLNRAQADISAYQKQSAAIDSTRAKIANLTKQHELLSQQIQNTTGDTSGLEREQLKLEQRMSSAQGTLERQEGRLSATSQRLEEAGVNTDNLAEESARLSTEIEELSKEQEQAAQSAQEYGDSAANAFQAAGEALAAAGIVAGIKEIGAAYVGTVQAAGEFGATMSNVEALSGANASQMAALTAQAKELGATTKFTANEAGEAMGYMGMAGWNAQQMLAGMPGVLDLAAASGEDLAGVSDIVTDALTGFGLTAADTGSFVDVLAAASTKSNTNVSMLGESFKYVAPLCGTLGYSAEDAAVSLGLMANAGIKGSQAGATLKTALANLAAPTEKQAAEMERLGISLTGAGGEMFTMQELVGNLRGAFSGMSEAEQSAAASALFGKEAMSGMLAIINASEADYRSLTESIQNSAGAAERMADIKLDNLAGDLTLLQSAADGLSLTIGEEFMPQVRWLVQTGTGVIGFIDTLIQDQPVLAKMIMGTAGAVGAVTAAVVAFSAAKKAAAVIDLAAMFATAGPILGVAAAVGAVTAGIIGWVEAANEGKPKINELTEAARGLDQAMAEAAVGYEDSQTELMATANMADHYLSRLEALNGITNRTSQQQAEYHATLAMLAETVPELAGAIDLTTDSIDGGTEALRAQTEAWKENAKAQAYQDYLKTVYAEQAAAELEHEKAVVLLTNAQADLRDMEAERSNILKEMHAMESNPSLYDGERYYQLEQRILALNMEYMDAEDNLEIYRQAVEESSAILRDAESETRDYENALANLSGQTEDTSDAMSGLSSIVGSVTNTNLTSVIGGMVTSGVELMGTLGKVSDEYYSTYNAAYDSISGQMGLFEAMSVEVESSVGDMIAALESQANYMAQYSANIKAASEMGLSDGLIAQLSDGSTESAAYLQAIVDGGAERIQELNDTFAEVEQGKEAFSTTIAQLQADVDRTMRDTSESVETAIEEMDLHAEALESSRNTFQGLIDGAQSMLEPVRIAYGNVALGALAAIQGSMVAGLSVTRGYATGTESAAPGFAIVGEEGPEAVFFGGGEQVLNARETAAMQRQSAISAMPMSSGGITINLSPVYNLSGNMDSGAVRNELERHDEKLMQLFKDFLEEYFVDCARKLY